jgi:hypothetical protein
LLSDTHQFRLCGSPARHNSYYAATAARRNLAKIEET